MNCEKVLKVFIYKLAINYSVWHILTKSCPLFNYFMSLYHEQYLRLLKFEKVSNFALFSQIFDKLEELYVQREQEPTFMKHVGELGPDDNFLHRFLPFELLTKSRCYFRKKWILLHLLSSDFSTLNSKPHIYLYSVFCFYTQVPFEMLSNQTSEDYCNFVFLIVYKDFLILLVLWLLNFTNISMQVLVFSVLLLHYQDCSIFGCSSTLLLLSYSVMQVQD